MKATGTEFSITNLKFSIPDFQFPLANGPPDLPIKPPAFDWTEIEN
jgi:hypothetical protein